VRRALLCSGRIYDRLLEERRRLGARPADAPLLRLEPLYPFPGAELRELLKGLPELKRLVWVQEEPRNMGAWRNLGESAAVPATGSFEVHQEEEAAVLEAALALRPAGARPGRAASPAAPEARRAARRLTRP
jgi:2-oxoglutarate dehydrogenase complex dehydrogenase (E1) component-like enzyme